MHFKVANLFAPVSFCVYSDNRVSGRSGALAGVNNGYVIYIGVAYLSPEFIPYRLVVQFVFLCERVKSPLLSFWRFWERPLG